MTFHFC
jgi:hypothetical protein